MSNNKDLLITQWENLDERPEAALSLFIEHPLKWYVSYSSMQEKSLVIISDAIAKPFVSSKSIRATSNRRNDGSYATAFTLQDVEQQDVFLTMADDLINFSNVDTEEKAIERVYNRYNAWVHLLSLKAEKSMSLDSQKGLIGELLKLREFLDKGMQSDRALSGWCGPDGNKKDFIYDFGWCEVKTIGESSGSISISSLEQLDDTEIGELSVYRISTCPPAQPGAFTLFDLVHDIMEMIGLDTGLKEEFIIKLANVGYVDKDDYKITYFNKISEKNYIVDANFPALKKKNIPSPICKVQYQLELSGIEPWECSAYKERL